MGIKDFVLADLSEALKDTEHSEYLALFFSPTQLANLNSAHHSYGLF